MKQKIIIVGGVAGGATAAARIRRLNEDAEIIILEKGPYVSFANCGLPYYIGQKIKERESLFVAKPALFKSRYNIDVRVLSEVISINKEEKKVLVKNHADNKTYEENYDKLLLATGSTPFVPKMDFDGAENVFTLWTIENVDQIKKYIEENKVQNVVVAGGGFIGIEMTENLRRIGVNVTLVEFGKQVMPPFDFDMANIIKNELKANGVKLELGVGVSKFEDKGKTVVLSDGRKIATDMTILSIGVRPNSKIAKEADLELNERGAIVVDDYMRTSDKDIFAVGDVVEVTSPINENKVMIALAGPANKQARTVASNILNIGEGVKYTGTMGASIVKIFNLEAGCVGENEKTLQRQGFVYGKDYDFSLIHAKNHVGYYPGASLMSVKLIFSKKDNRVLGAQIVGQDDVAKRIDVISTLMRFKGTIYDLAYLELSYAPPFNGPKDPVNNAGFVATNMVEGLTNTVNWLDIKDSDEYTFLDVRFPGEIIFNPSIPGSAHIEVDKLRENLHLLDKNKKYAIYCAIGLRGYVAERILRQNGFDAYNIKGGILTMKSFE